MKKRLLILLLILSATAQAADTELQDLAEMTAIISTDILYVVDDPAGTPDSQKITVLNLFDMIDTSAELLAILTNETGTGALVFAISPTLVTPILGTITSGVGTALTALNGENIQNDTIDDDSIDFADVTGVDLTLTDCGAITSTGTITATVGFDIVGAADIDYGSVDVLDHTFITDGTGDGEIVLPNDSIGDNEIDWSGLTTSADFTVTGILITSVGIDGVGAIDLDYGSVDITDHTFVTDGTGTAEIVLPAGSIDGTEILDDTIDSADYNADSLDNEHINWGDIDNLGDEGTITVADTADATSFVALWESATGDLAAKSDAALLYAADTGTLAATEFSGGGSGLTLASTDLSDTADLLYETELDDLSELTGQIGDVTAFITDDDMPAAGADPDVDAAGEIGRDTDGANEAGDSSLRGHDGSNQFLYSRKLKTLNFTLIEPDQIDAYDFIPVWHNTSGMTFTIVQWKAWSDDDNVSFEIEEVAQTDYTARTQVDACEIATDLTGVFYGSDLTITHAAIEHDHSLAIDFDGANDTPDYVQISITGWFNADVD